jgi:hypothetical protein
VDLRASSISVSSVYWMTSLSRSLRKSLYRCKNPFASIKLTIDFDWTMASFFGDVIVD